MVKFKKISIIILAFIGLITSIKLSMIYVNANFNPYSLPSFCSINNVIDCDSVAKTSFSQFLGIPLAIWGLLLYIFLLFLCSVEYLKKINFLKFLEVFKNPYSYIFCITFLSFLISILLACISIFEIKKICILCVLTYFLDLAIALVSKSWGEGFLYDFKVSIQDFIDAIKVKKYAISFSLLVLIAAVFLTFTSLSYVFTPQVKKFKSLEFFRNLKSNPYKVEGNTLGDEQAKIIIHEYIDYNCPSCYMSNIMLHRAVSELSGIKIVQHNLPLDTSCNPYVPVQVHENSCMLARYSLAAKSQNKFWDMNELLFDNTPKTEDEILKLAKKLNMDVPQLYEDANSEAIKKELKEEIDNTQKENIIGTPTLIINMSKYTGVVPYYDLKEKLIKMGASERK